MKVHLFLCTFLWALSSSYGGELAQPPKEVLRELQYLVGTWQYQGRIGEKRVEGTWSTRWAPGKHCLIQQSSRSEGEQTVHSTGLIGWDPAAERVIERAFRTDNASVVLSWDVSSSDMWQGQLTGMEDGNSIDCRIRLTKKGSDEFLYEETQGDNQETEIIARKSSEKNPSRVEIAVPEAAIREMQYRVGKWESDMYTDGKKGETRSLEVTRWDPEKHSIRASGYWTEEGVNYHGSALIGWDPEKKQLVEHWFTSDGGYATFCYDITKEQNTWVGSFAWVYGDGRKYEGKSIVEKTGRDRWIWTATFVTDGEEHTWRSVNERVKETERRTN